MGHKRDRKKGQKRAEHTHERTQAEGAPEERGARVGPWPVRPERTELLDRDQHRERASKQDLNALIRDAGTVMYPLIGGCIRLLVELSHESLPVALAGSTFEAMMRCLALAVVDAFPEGGAMSISTRRVRFLGWLGSEDGDGDSPSCALLRIAVREAVSDKAESLPIGTNGQRRLTTSGLSSIHDLMQQNGGNMKVEYPMSRKTVINLYFPLFREESATTVSLPSTDLCSIIALSLQYFEKFVRPLHSHVNIED